MINPGVATFKQVRPGSCISLSRPVSSADTDVAEVSTPELQDVVRLEDRYGRV
jgi:hypothetical protein